MNQKNQAALAAASGDSSDAGGGGSGGSGSVPIYDSTGAIIGSTSSQVGNNNAIVSAIQNAVAGVVNAVSPNVQNSPALVTTKTVAPTGTIAQQISQIGTKTVNDPVTVMPVSFPVATTNKNVASTPIRTPFASVSQPIVNPIATVSKQGVGSPVIGVNRSGLLKK